MSAFIVKTLTDPTALAVFFGALLIAWIFYPRKKYRLPPGPLTLPFIGCEIALMRTKHGNRLYQEFFDWCKIYGSVIRVKTVLGEMIVINEITEAMEALVTKSSDTAGREVLYSFDKVTDGSKDIANADYSERVKYQRRIAGGALRNLLSAGKMEVMTHASIEKGIQVLRKKAEDKEAFDPRPLINLQVYNIICAMCFNVNFELDDENFQAIYNANKDATELFASGDFLVDYFPPARYFPDTAGFKKLKELMDVIYDYSVKQIEEHKERFDPDNLNDFIDHMLKIESEEEGGKKITLDDEHYKQTIVDIFNAGTETTSATLLFIVLLLTEHPEVQAKVQEEIDTVVGSSRLPGVADKAKMPYSEAVMYEAMRFGTILPIGVPHKAMCDLTIGGYEIPKGTVITINHHALHRDPKEWKNPEVFDPNNFLDDEGHLLPKPRSFLPFSAGKRACLGEAVVKPEMFMIFTAMFQQFNFKFEEGHKHDLSFQDMSFVILPQPFKILVESRRDLPQPFKIFVESRQ